MFRPCNFCSWNSPAGRTQIPTRVGIWLTKTALQFISLLDIQFFSDTTPFRLKYLVHLRTFRKGLLIVCWGVYSGNLVSKFLRKAHKYLPVDRHIPTQLNLQHRCKKLKSLSLYPILYICHRMAPFINNRYFKTFWTQLGIIKGFQSCNNL